MAESLLDSLPSSIKRRFSYIDSYCYQTVAAIEEQRNIRKADRLSRYSVAMDELRFLAIVYCLRRLLVEGAFATKSTIRSLQDLDINGFQVGTVYFESNNDNATLAATLAKQMNSIITEIGLPADYFDNISLRKFITRWYDAQ